MKKSQIKKEQTYRGLNDLGEWEQFRRETPNEATPAKTGYLQVFHVESGAEVLNPKD